MHHQVSISTLQTKLVAATLGAHLSRYQRVDILIHRSTVQATVVLTFCVLEEDTLCALLHSVKLTKLTVNQINGKIFNNVYAM